MNFSENIRLGKMYEPRRSTDRIFRDPDARFLYDGAYDSVVKFVQSHQVKNTALWVSFVEQFKLQVDSEDHGWSGEFYGKMMRGACWVYKYTLDEELYSTLEGTVRYLLECAEEDGRISSYKRDGEFLGWDMWCRKYVLLGTQFFYEICKDEELKAQIITVLNRHLDYILSKIGAEEGKIDILNSTTVSDWTWGALNSSSILEPVVRQYLLTGKKEYLDFATYLVERGGSSWGNIYTLAIEGKLAPYEYPVKKAYEATSYFEGVLEYYRVTGNEDARRAYLNFIDLVLKTDFTVIGCSGCTHELFDNSTVMQTVESDIIKQETCVTVTLMKALEQALCLTGDAKYANAIERAGYNAMLGSVNLNSIVAMGTNAEAAARYRYDKVLPFMRLMKGYTFDSYAPLYKDKRNRQVGGFRRMPGDKSYGCCACIGSAGVALMPLTSVMATKDGIAINHLMNGTATVGGVTLEIKTSYPYGEDAEIKIVSAPECEMTVAVRIPDFASGEMTVDGKTAEDAGLGYALITRSFKAGETVNVHIPKKLSLTRMGGKVCFSYGAIVLALDERVEDINLTVSGEVKSYRPTDTGVKCREAVRVTMENGKSFTLIDYASAGAEWDKPKNKISVWIDEE